MFSDLRPNESYLSEMKVNDHKRQASPSLLDQEDKMFKKRHCVANQSHVEHETSSSREKCSESMQPSCGDKNGVYDFRSS